MKINNLILNVLNSSGNWQLRALFATVIVGIVSLLVIWLASVTTIALMNLAQYIDGTIGTYLIQKGAPRLMRRVLLIWAVIILLLSLKKAGWKGWRDCGWTYAEESALLHPRWSQFCRGMAVGIITLGSIAALTVFLGLHQLRPLTENGWPLAGSIIAFIFSGLTIALIEETICRGILFRVFARTWNIWISAIITSALFALAHFIGQNNISFQGDSFLVASLNATMATLGSILPPMHSMVQFINLILLGVALCVFVMQTKTIWMSVGTHAAWIFIVKLHSYTTDFNPVAFNSIWLGKRNDFMDSLGATIIITGLILITLLIHQRNKRNGLPVNIRGQLWHITPSMIDRLAAFLKVGEDMFAGGRILKAYSGCRVVSRDGLVLKKYWPRNRLAGIKFAVRPLRGRRAFLLANKLIEHGLPTPHVPAWSATRSCGLLLTESIIVLEIKNSEQLSEWLGRKDDRKAVRLKVMEAYGNLMAAFHRNGYSNRDFKPENVMCSKEQPWQLQVVDLDGVKKHLFISRRRAGRDLMRVGTSLASFGWTNAEENSAFFDTYNRDLPPRLHRRSFPGL